jgi:hypothetical protein
MKAMTAPELVGLPCLSTFELFGVRDKKIERAVSTL